MQGFVSLTVPSSLSLEEYKIIVDDAIHSENACLLWKQPKLSLETHKNEHNSLFSWCQLWIDYVWNACVCHGWLRWVTECIWNALVSLQRTLKRKHKSGDRRNLPTADPSGFKCTGGRCVLFIDLKKLSWLVEEENVRRLQNTAEKTFLMSLLECWNKKYQKQDY